MVTRFFGFVADGFDDGAALRRGGGGGDEAACAEDGIESCGKESLV